ncbi:MAG: alpha/beta fold hydrolase [Planctomycetota bacterium]|jgi:medium-chain acyl-[acyl-carrier-protein] hydrolase|nr:alpha/beta fold hydrolase [Planctomycetota bacterium]
MTLGSTQSENLFDTWVFRKSKRPKVSLRLLGIPYAGGGSAVFQDWHDAFDSRIEFGAVLLPGRERRWKEPARKSVRSLANSLATALEPSLSVPLALYGHSMGALIAFELARELGRRGFSQPVHVFLGARCSPEHKSQDSPIHRLPRDEFVAALTERYDSIPEEIRNEPEILDVFLPSLRADITLNETYVCDPAPPLFGAITALIGSDDLWTSKATCEKWSLQTAGSFRLLTLPGGHFFLREHPSLLFEEIGRDLSRYLG